MVEKHGLVEIEKDKLFAQCQGFLKLFRLAQHDCVAGFYSDVLLSALRTNDNPQAKGYTSTTVAVCLLPGTSRADVPLRGQADAGAGVFMPATTFSLGLGKSHLRAGSLTRARVAAEPAVICRLPGARQQVPAAVLVTDRQENCSPLHARIFRCIYSACHSRCSPDLPVFWYGG